MEVRITASERPSVVLEKGRVVYMLTCIENYKDYDTWFYASNRNTAALPCGRGSTAEQALHRQKPYH